ncbi:MAG: UDP-N-acetylmuramoyl-tripeptide--D-alanyl-D-alanine ligase [Acidimicrobiia bacterium]
MRLTAAEVARRADGEVVAGAPDAVITSWTFDSRAVEPGACFVALMGDRDGHDFVADAFRAGARVALVERPLRDVDVGEGHALVLTTDVVRGLQAVARSVRHERRDVRVVGVAGSTGKTSTKDLLAATLRPHRVHASPESYNNEFGLPITLLNAPRPASAVVAEMGERFPGDIAALCDIAKPDFGIITNVGLAHAEYLGGEEGAAAVLAELLEALPRRGLAVLNADDRWTPWLAERTEARVVTVGFSDAADHRITDVELDRSLFPTFSMGVWQFQVPIRGAHQVANAAMAAVLANHAFGMMWDDVAFWLRHARASRWRMELTKTESGITVLNDAYNANPASMEAALRALAELDVEGRRIAVLGDMRELGDRGPEAHAAIGDLARELRIDVVVGVGTGGAEIGRRAGSDAFTAGDAAAAIAMVDGLVQPGDAVLVKASRALGLQVVAEHLTDASVDR